MINYQLNTIKSDKIILYWYTLVNVDTIVKTRFRTTLKQK